MILILGGISRNCPRVFYFKDYNAAIHISGKKRKFKRLWWLAPQKTRNETFLENWWKKLIKIEKVSQTSGNKPKITESIFILLT